MWFFDNEDITALPIHERSRLGIGYLAQERSVFQETYSRGKYYSHTGDPAFKPGRAQKTLEELLAELNIAHLAKSKAYTFSGGRPGAWRLPGALVTRPSFILLDEPFFRN